jgi:hypothetical protein
LLKAAIHALGDDHYPDTDPNVVQRTYDGYVRFSRPRRHLREFRLSLRVVHYRFASRLAQDMQPNRAKALGHLQHQFKDMRIACDIEFAPVCQCNDGCITTIKSAYELTRVFLLAFMTDLHPHNIMMKKEAIG